MTDIMKPVSDLQDDQNYRLFGHNQSHSTDETSMTKTYQFGCTQMPCTQGQFITINSPIIESSQCHINVYHFPPKKKVHIMQDIFVWVYKYCNI